MAKGDISPNQIGPNHQISIGSNVVKARYLHLDHVKGVQSTITAGLKAAYTKSVDRWFTDGMPITGLVSGKIPTSYGNGGKSAAVFAPALDTLSAFLALPFTDQVAALPGLSDMDRLDLSMDHADLLRRLIAGNTAE